MAKILTTASRLVCPHQGHVDVGTTTNQRVFAGSEAAAGKALVVSDVHPVTGCLFMQGNKPSPCVTVEWTKDQGDVGVDETAVVTESTVGTCKSAERAAQGFVALVDTQGSVDVG